MQTPNTNHAHSYNYRAIFGQQTGSLESKENLISDITLERIPSGQLIYILNPVNPAAGYNIIHLK